MKKNSKVRLSRNQGYLKTLWTLLFLLIFQSGFAALHTAMDEDPAKRNRNGSEAMNALFLQQQEIEVTGQVVSAESGDPLPGVSIYEQGNQANGTSSDMNGYYSITVPENATIIFSFVGYQQTAVQVDGRKQIDVEMATQVQEMEEVVVVGYGRQSKITTTGSIGSVDADEIENTSSPTLGDALTGKTPGLATVQTTGQPGASDPDLYLRGIGTMNNNDPLIIIDGVPNTERAFMQLNPANIANLSILKDASATAVYGVKGANGVIIVDTKRGQTGRTRITANASYGMQVATKLPNYANSYDWAQTYNQSYLNDGDSTKLIPQSVVNHYRDQDMPLIYPSHDWVKEIFDNSAMEARTNINISGGSENVRYFSSLGYFKQDGLLSEDLGEDQNFSYDRFNLQTNVDLTVTPTTEISFTSSARVGIRRQPGGGNEFWGWINSAPPMASAGIVDGNYIKVDRGLYQPWTSSRDPLEKGLSDKGYQENKENRLNINMDVRQKLKALSPALEGLEFRTKIGYRSGFNEWLTKNGPSFPTYNGYFNQDVVNSNPQLSDSTVVLNKLSDPGLQNWNYNYGANRYIYWEAGFDYQTSIDRHNIGGLLLYNQNKDYYHNLAFSNIPTGNAGLVGRVTYDYNQQYMVEFNLGYNGSENFAKEQRFGWFPSVSAGWVVSKEKFMQGLSFLDYFKIRGSYGIVGSDQAGGNARFIYIGDSFNRNVNQFYGYNFGNDIPEYLAGVHEASIGNEDVTWETAQKQNYGIDMRMFNDRLTLNVDYFYEYRDDILMFRNSAPTWLSVTLPPVNIGEVENKGFEVQLGWNHKVGDLRYSLSGNFSRAQNKILFMDEVPPREPYQTRTGHPLNSNYGYVWEGFYTEEEIAQVEAGELPSPPNVTVQPGDMRYKDLNGDGIIDKADQKVIGYPPQPQISGGINGSISFKGFDLSFGLQGAAQVSRNITYIYQDPFGPADGHGVLQTHVNYAWTPERAADGSVKWPRHSFANDEYNNRMSTFWNRNSSYLRLKRAEIGYTLSGDVLQRIGMQKVRIYVRGTNLYTLTHDDYTMVDPERQPGQHSMQHPLMKNFIGGLSLSF